MTPAKVVLKPGGPPAKESTLLWKQGLPKRIIEHHERSQPSSPCEIFLLPHVSIFGGGWVHTSEGVLADGSLFPNYCKHYFENALTPEAAIKTSELSTIHVNKCWHILHFNCAVYGHWLLEAFPKLFLIRELIKRWPEYGNVPIVVPRTFPLFVGKAVSVLLPDIPLLSYDPGMELVATDLALLPTWGDRYFYNPFIGECIDRLVAKHNIFNHDRIFVFRRTHSLYRRLENIHELTAIAAEFGFFTVYPEDYTFGEQVAIFGGARCVIGEYGSAMHNAIFSGAHCRVFALNWVNECQSRIARFRCHTLGFQLPADGKPVTYKFDSQDQQLYTIDPAIFKRRLAQLVKLPGGFKS